MPRIKTLSLEEATGPLKEIYDGLVQSRGKLADVHKIQSLRPQSIVAHMDLYMEIMYSRSEISRPHRELIATVVSIANGCAYCTQHHGEALLHYWKKPSKLEALKRHDWESLLNEKEMALCAFAEGLTQNPGAHESEDFTGPLREQGVSDAGILDVVLVTAYFNFVNRIVLSLGVELEGDGGTGYKY